MPCTMIILTAIKRILLKLKDIHRKDCEVGIGRHNELLPRPNQKRSIFIQRIFINT